MIIKSNLQLILVLITKTNLTQNICPLTPISLWFRLKLITVLITKKNLTQSICPLTPIMILFSIAIIKYYNMLIYKQTWPHATNFLLTLSNWIKNHKQQPKLSINITKKDHSLISTLNSDSANLFPPCNTQHARKSAN